MPNHVKRPHRGYVFCPEFTPAKPERLFPDESDDTDIFLFGPAGMPDVLDYHSQNDPSPLRSGNEDVELTSVETVPLTNPSAGAETQDAVALVPSADAAPAAPSLAARIVLGKVHASDTSVSWNVGIAGNPHLMIVGLPGMGKTTSLVSLCRQLAGRKDNSDCLFLPR